MGFKQLETMQALLPQEALRTAPAKKLIVVNKSKRECGPLQAEIAGIPPL